MVDMEPLQMGMFLDMIKVMILKHIIQIKKVKLNMELKY